MFGREAKHMAGGTNGDGRDNSDGPRPQPSVDEPYEDFAKKNADWDRRVRESVEDLRETSKRERTVGS